MPDYKMSSMPSCFAGKSLTWRYAKCMALDQMRYYIVTTVTKSSRRRHFATDGVRLFLLNPKAIRLSVCTFRRWPLMGYAHCGIRSIGPLAAVESERRNPSHQNSKGITGGGFVLVSKWLISNNATTCD